MAAESSRASPPRPKQKGEPVSYRVRLIDSGNGTLQHGLALESLGAMAQQVAACAAECESFLTEQVEAWERLEQRVNSYLDKMRLILAGAVEIKAERNGKAHPHGNDPVVAAVLADFAALRSAESVAECVEACAG
jgi:hypothetical protein